MIGRGGLAAKLLENELKLPPMPSGFGRGAGVGRAAMSRSLAMNGPPGHFIRQPNKCSIPGGTAAKGGAAMGPPLLVSTGGTAEITTTLNKLTVSDDTELPSRPGYAEDGVSIPIITNFIKVKFTDTDVFQYHITYDPPVDSKFLRHKLLEPRLADNRAWRFDGAILYSSEQLPSQGYFTSLKENTGEDITMRYTLTKTISIEKCIPLLNIIFRTVLSKLRYTRMGRNLYDPARSVHIPKHKLELWPGYVTSVSQLDGGFMLQTNVSHKMLRTDTVMDMLLEIHKTQPHNLQSRAVKEIVGHVIMTRYNNQTYRVDDIVWDETPRSCFEDRRGNKISYIEYYRDQYSIIIKDCSQPLLLHRMKPKRGQNQQEERLIYLIPELCAMTGLSQSTMDDFMVRKDIVAHTRLDPRDRIKAIKGFICNVKESPEATEELRRWNLHIDDETLHVQGRVLESEQIIFGGGAGGGNTHTVGERADFSQATTVNAPLTPVNLDNWLLVCTQRDQNKGRDLVTVMKEGARKLGMRVAAPVVLPLRDDRTESFIRAITSNHSNDVQLVVTIVPSDRDDRYNAIKQLCYIDIAIASQVIRTRTLSQPQKLRNVVQKIMLQINAKLGGELWACNIPLGNAMIVGIDTYHDPTSRAGSSFTGFVASMNKITTQYFSTSREEERGQEFSSSLQNMMTAALQKYLEKNAKLPERIIVFRDGVSEGQFSVVKQYEVAQFEAAFSHLEGGYKPQLVVVVVQKRIRTRMFYSEGEGNRGKVMNAPPGTVLDHTVTSDTLYDFYLVSQHVGKGTVTPSHYVVVHNTSTLKPDHIQKLSYKLTHMYWNWPGTVRVPSVCLYAHKIAYMHGQHLHRPAAPAMSDRLFYL